VSRAEPAKSLFPIPPGYTVREDAPGMIIPLRVEKE
jgi:hypothetical protein